MKSIKRFTQISIMVLSGFSSAFGAGLAIDFGADYTAANINATRTLGVDATVDADFDGTADDRAGSLAFGTVFSPPSSPSWTTPSGKSGGVIKFGVSVANINSAADPVDLSISRISSADIIQSMNGAGTAAMRMATAWYWEKSSFLNGADAGANLSFLDGTASLSAYFNNGGTPTTGSSRTGHFLVQDGSSWYISKDLWANTSGTKEINAATAEWYVFDPQAGTLFWDRASTGTAVTGSTLTNITALGLYVQHELIDGTTANAIQQGFTSMQASVIETPVVIPTSVAVDFGGDYRDNNQNAISTLELETGDYDFDGTANDRRGYRPMDSTFLNPIIIEAGKEAGVADRNKTIYAGYQIANFNSAADPGLPPNYKYSGSGEALQATSAAGTTSMGMTFAPYVKKVNFLNGNDYANTNLVFEDSSDSVSFNIRQITLGQTARALVQNGSSWYVSGTQTTSAVPLSVNGYAETWYAYNPSVNLFLNTSALGTGVSGSALSDIQAFGVLVQGLNIDGSITNAANFQVSAFKAKMVQTNAPPAPSINRVSIFVLSSL